MATPPPRPRAAFLTGALIVLAIAGAAALLVAAHVQDELRGGTRRFALLAPSGRNVKLQAPVRMQGLRVGMVDDVVLREDAGIEVRFHVDPKYGHGVRSNATAALVEPPLGLGLTYLHLDPGSLEFPEATEGTIENKDPESLGALVERSTAQVEPMIAKVKRLERGVEAMMGSVERIQSDLDEGDGFLSAVRRDPAVRADLARTSARLTTMAADIDDVRAAIDRGEGTLGRLFGKPGGTDAVRAEVDRVVARASESIAGIEAAADRLKGSARRVSKRLDQVAASLEGLDAIFADVRAAAEEAAQIAARFAAGRGTIGRLAKDGTLLADFRQFLADMAATGRDSSEMSPFNMVIGLAARQLPRETPPPTEGVAKTAAK